MLKKLILYLKDELIVPKQDNVGEGEPPVERCKELRESIDPKSKL